MCFAEHDLIVALVAELCKYSSEGSSSQFLLFHGALIY